MKAVSFVELDHCRVVAAQTPFTRLELELRRHQGEQPWSAEAENLFADVANIEGEPLI